MKNIKRTAWFMMLSRSIISCVNIDQLTTLKELVLNYYHQKKQDAGELLALYAEREHDLSPVMDLDEDSMESLYHQQKNQSPC